MSRKRKLVDLRQPIARALADINISTHLQRTMRDEPVIWFDSSPDDLEIIILFSTDENFAALTQCNIIFADSTFKIASDLFEQL